MYRHPFDAISFFFGLLFTAGALSAMLVDDPWPFDRGGVWAIMLIVGGLGLLLSALRPGGDRQPAAVTAPVTAAVAGTDPSLVDAHREIDEYLGEPVPAPTAEDPVTAEVLTASVDDSDPTEAGSQDAVTAEVVTESVEEPGPVGKETPDDPTISPDGGDGHVS